LTYGNAYPAFTPPRRAVEIGARHMAEPKITQRELARILGVSNALIARIEIGDRTPSRELAEAWAQALRVEASVIFPDVFDGAGE
jgi:transcriptional regulator with XRE-family HTH domain